MPSTVGRTKIYTSREEISLSIKPWHATGAFWLQRCFQMWKTKPVHLKNQSSNVYLYYYFYFQSQFLMGHFCYRPTFNINISYWCPWSWWNPVLWFCPLSCHSSKSAPGLSEPQCSGYSSVKYRSCISHGFVDGSGSQTNVPSA